MSGVDWGNVGGSRLAAAKRGELVTEKQAAKALGISLERLRLRIRLGLITAEWVRGHRYVFLSNDR